MKRGLVSILLLVLGCPLLVSHAQTIRLGVMGDSLSDEYFEQSDLYWATNWVQQLVQYRGVEVGPKGPWGDFRRTGYQWNWALYGATSSSLLLLGQHKSLAAQIVPEQIDYAVLAIGANEFHPLSAAYAGIYEGTWSPSRIRAYSKRVRKNIEKTIVTCQRAGAKMVLVSIVDYGSTPYALARPSCADAEKRERVATVLSDLNEDLKRVAQKRGIPLADWYKLQRAAMGAHTNLNQHLMLGGVEIQWQQTDPGPWSDPNPTAAFVDGIHPHTTIQGLLANVVLQALNDGYGANIPLFSEQEILEYAGIEYGGTDTLQPQIGSYANFVVLPPSAAVDPVRANYASNSVSFSCR